MTKTTLYLGLNDKETHNQEIDIISAYKIATNICIQHCGGCTILNSQGFYTHENGTIVIENTLKIEILDATKESILKTVNDLKTAFNQETILQQIEEVNATFI